MKPLNKNEQRLLTVLGVMLFLGGNLFGLQFLLKKNRELTTKLANLKIEEKESVYWMKEKALWSARKQWLDEHQPKTSSLAGNNSDLLETLISSARKRNITIVEQTLLDPATQPFYQEVSVKLRLTGTLETITKWLAEIQQPAKFQAVTEFNLKSDSEPPKVKCELQVSRRYAINP